MATLVGGTAVVIPGTGLSSESDPKYRNYLQGANVNGPATLLQLVNAPSGQIAGSGTISVGPGADPKLIYALRYTIDYPVLLVSLKVSITVAATANWRAGVYGSGGNGDILPKTLLADSGNVATNPAGTKSATLNVRLQPGNYWFVTHFQNSAGSTINVHDVTRSDNLGTDSTLVPVNGLTQLQNFGALPATWGSTYTLSTTQIPTLYAEFAV